MKTGRITPEEFNSVLRRVIGKRRVPKNQDILSAVKAIWGKNCNYLVFCNDGMYYGEERENSNLLP